MATIRNLSPADESSTSPDTDSRIAVADLNTNTPVSSASPPVQTAPPPPKPKITRQMIDARFEALLRQAQANRPSEDISLIRKAWEFCVQHHAGQQRASGEPYIIHPLEVAEVVAEMKTGLHRHRGRPAPRLGRGHARHQRARSPPVSATRSPTSSKASPRSTRSSLPTAKTARPRTSAKCSWPWSPTYAWC